MAEKRIIWAKRAKSELKETFDYYNERNGNNNYSLTLLKQIEKLTLRLVKHEQLGRSTSNGKTRVLNLKVYLIFYEVEGAEIRIVSFWDNRRNPEDRIANPR